MEYRRIGQTDIKVSEVSLGCWTLGGLNWVNGQPNGWANVDEDEAVRAVHHALDRGVNHFDNADVYGNGRAERMLAKALGPRSKDVIIATKVGHFPGTAAHAYEPRHIRHQCEQSLINLKRDAIDIYYFHHGNFGREWEYLDGAVETMLRLKEEGKIRAVGQSAYAEEHFEKLAPIVKPDCLQSWANCMDDHYIREGSRVRKLLDERKMTFVCFSPLGQGLLLGKYSSRKPPKFAPGDHRRGGRQFSAKSLAALDPKVRKLKRRFGKSVEELARVALQYLLASPAVACVIPGFRNTEQVEINVSAAGKPLSGEDVAFVREVFSEGK